jgi:hypothetical protein
LVIGSLVFDNGLRVLSKQAQQDWQAFIETIDNVAMERDQLNAFLIGIHRRRETLYAHELKVLLSKTPLPPSAQDELVSFIEPALALLTAYDQVLQSEDEEDEDEEYGEGPGIGLGDLVI